MFSISWASGLPLAPWHKLALGSVTSHYPRPPCGPLLGCVRIWFPISSKFAGFVVAIEVRVVVVRHDDRGFLDYLTHLPEDIPMHRVVSCEIICTSSCIIHLSDVCCTSTRTSRRHNSTSKHHFDSPNARYAFECWHAVTARICPRWGSEISARSHHLLRTCSLSFSLVFHF